ncbi:MAG TPA: hypothetical protein VMS77_05505 [Conexivisphaerales archaeon]|nr:hypothetical protein [Conexivisphaerales archaeon]
MDVRAARVPWYFPAGIYIVVILLVAWVISGILGAWRDASSLAYGIWLGVIPALAIAVPVFGLYGLTTVYHGWKPAELSISPDGRVSISESATRRSLTFHARGARRYQKTILAIRIGRLSRVNVDFDDLDDLEAVLRFVKEQAHQQD